jgi:hypothetical protein
MVEKRVPREKMPWGALPRSAPQGYFIKLKSPKIREGKGQGGGERSCGRAAVHLVELFPPRIFVKVLVAGFIIRGGILGSS